MPAFPFPKTQLTTLIFLFIAQFILAQTEPSITGRVATPENESLPYASVALLNPKDSTMINFTTTDMDGKFKILEDSRDSLLIQIHSTGFISHFENIVFRNEPINLNNILLKEDIGVLDEVTISAVIPIQIKKDTVAFNTSAFKVNHDDNIEDMLEKLPGMEIDSDGKMIAQGNEVTKIYVDGKEFFGGDPSVVMKNLSADVIAKVEIIDKKSDESELTGVSDGNKQVILNFTLKKDKKNRGFGKASAGIGLENRYFASGNYNQFSPKTQFSSVASSNNINVTGSNIKDFLHNSNGLGDESDGEDSNITKKNLSGFLNTQIVGLHFGHEFQKKESLNADYTYNKSKNDGNSFTNRVSSINQDTNINSDIDSKFDNRDTNHNLNFNYKNQSKKNTSYFAKGAYNVSDRNTSLNRITNIYNLENIVRTNNNSQVDNEHNRQKGNIKLNYYHKLNDEGKNFSVGTFATTEKLKRINKISNTTKRNIDTDTPRLSITDRKRDEKIANNSINYNIKYTEPLGNNHFIKIEGVNTFRKINEDVVQSKTIIEDETHQDVLRYKYKHKEYNYQSRIGYSYNIEKLNIYAGAEYQDLTRNFGEIEKDKFNKNSSFLNPKFFIQYKPKTGRKYRLNYQKVVRSPNIYHSHAVVNDLDSRYIRKGNPDIEAEHSDKLNLRINIHDYKSALTFYGNFNISHTDDAIVPIVTIDDNDDGDIIRTRNFDNIGTKDNLTTSFSLSKKINRLPIRYTIKNRNSFIKSNALIGIELNDVNANRYSANLRFENHNKKIFDLKVGGEYTLNQTNYSIRTTLNREFTTQHYYSKFDYDITKKLSFNTQFDYYIYSYDTSSANNNFSTDVILPLWNTAISYSFTAKKNNVIKILLIDILDRNLDIRRRNNVNYYEETFTESLGRYAIISYTYRINNGNRKQLKKSRKS